MAEYVSPMLKAKSYSCPHCGAYAQQNWKSIRGRRKKKAPGVSIEDLVEYIIKAIYVSKCLVCEKESIWYGNKMIWPTTSTAPLPTKDMPKDVEQIYSEARNIVGQSPRAAAALLRLSIEMLMPHLGETKGKLNTRIKNLVTKGLPAEIQQAWDIVRVKGNEALHQGEVILTDDDKTASSLFKMVNMIVERMITHPKETKLLYEGLPEEKRKGIENRDKNK